LDFLDEELVDSGNKSFKRRKKEQSKDKFIEF
jgi:hypothetical protein